MKWDEPPHPIPVPHLGEGPRSSDHTFIRGEKGAKIEGSGGEEGQIVGHVLGSWDLTESSRRRDHLLIARRFRRVTRRSYLTFFL